MERRVWTQTRSALYPHLYTLLVAPPGVGKSQAIGLATELIYMSKKNCMDAPHMAPDSMTRASLIDTLSESSRRKVMPGGKVVEYHSLFIPSGEFGVLVSSHDMDFLSVLNGIFDAGRVHRERRRGGNLDTEIICPQINILAGSQPGFLGNLLPEEAWTMGFTSRLLLIYSATGPNVDFFGGKAQDLILQNDLVVGLRKFYTMYGEMKWTEEALNAARTWIEAGCPPVPMHSKLEHYRPRRMLFVAKLCMVSAMSDDCRMTITEEDFERAKSWLLSAEDMMPDIFRDMAGRSDAQIIEDLHFELWTIYAKTRKPVPEAAVYNFIKNKAPIEKVKMILEIAEKSNIVSKTAFGYVPKPKNEHGVE